MSSKEGLSGGMAILLAVSAFNIGALVGRLAEDTDSRIRDVQDQNAQVYELLQPTYDGLGELVLDDEEKSFGFSVTPEGEKPQTCEGKYQVTDGTAKLTGNIACTTTVKAGN